MLAAMVAGCAGDGPERAVVTGKITYQGQPLEKGRIRFVPTKDTKAPISGAEITDGAYVVDGRGGVPVGSYQIEITAQRIDSKRAADDNSLAHQFDNVGGPPMEQYIPEKYNTKTELEITIQPGSRKITRDIDLAGEFRW